MKKAIIAFILLLPLSSLAQKELASDHFLDMFEQQFPKMFCQPEQFARVCFTYNFNQCVQHTQNHLSECMASIAPQVPNAITSRAQATEWGGKIGRCTGSRFGRRQLMDANITTQCVNVASEAFIQEFMNN
ncbi:hypothetical protein CWC31_17060 [Pseudoalteromonas ruthenica]|uniref:hypothetical protein n=1 Tax=Pseudoalteromonas ruthenica TaxID=151081 RepID=UPI0011080DF8|nr:hypothetical protein [Pseudoalteromonas ruthenica]TLX49362.1 hypothetical protein CWC31_17060 [Pseudoalteromonas ruthenica]